MKIHVLFLSKLFNSGKTSALFLNIVARGIVLVLVRYRNRRCVGI